MSTPKKILVVDIEATCWENEPPNLIMSKRMETRNEIIEIGISVVDIKTKKLELSRSIITIPTKTEISGFCTQLTTLTPEYVQEHGIDFWRAVNILHTEFGSDKNVFASWGDYDRKAFEKNCKWNDCPYPFANMHLNVKSLFAAKMGWNGGVAKCAENLGIPFEGTQHRGVDDSRIIAKILIKLLGA